MATGSLSPIFAFFGAAPQVGCDASDWRTLVGAFRALS